MLPLPFSLYKGKVVKMNKTIKIMGIYKITNLVNGKVYIGSSVDLYSRKIKHFTTLKKGNHHNYHLQKSWNKYGEENFLFEIIEYLDDENKLIEREQYWIDLLNSYNNSIGYNILPKAGSQLGAKRTETARKNIKYAQKSKIIIQIDFKGQIIKEWFSLREIERELGFSRGTITKSCNSNFKTSYGYIWIYKHDLYSFDLDTYDISEEFDPKQYNNVKRIVLQYTKGGLFVNEWNSIKEASLELKIDRTSISQCCRGKKKSAGGYVWQYKDYQPDSYYVYLGDSKFERRIKGVE
jgi:group I intron endonuclease